MLCLGSVWKSGCSRKHVEKVKFENSFTGKSFSGIFRYGKTVLCALWRKQQLKKIYVTYVWVTRLQPAAAFAFGFAFGFAAFGFAFGFAFGIAAFASRCNVNATRRSLWRLTSRSLATPQATAAEAYARCIAPPHALMSPERARALAMKASSLSLSDAAATGAAASGFESDEVSRSNGDGVIWQDAVGLDRVGVQSIKNEIPGTELEKPKKPPSPICIDGTIASIASAKSLEGGAPSPTASAKLPTGLQGLV